MLASDCSNRVRRRKCLARLLSAHGAFALVSCVPGTHGNSALAAAVSGLRGLRRAIRDLGGPVGSASDEAVAAIQVPGDLAADTTTDRRNKTSRTNSKVSRSLQMWRISLFKFATFPLAAQQPCDHNRRNVRRPSTYAVHEGQSIIERIQSSLGPLTHEPCVEIGTIVHCHIGEN